MENSYPKYAEVVLPLALSNTLTYSLPEDIAEKVSIGSRVIVPVKNKFFTGIIVSFPATVDASFELKDISLLLDSKPVVRSPQLRLWEWISDYYLCSIGEVYRAAIPTGLKIESETSIGLNQDMELEDILPSLNENELKVVMALQAKKKAVITSVLEKELQIRTLPSIIERLLNSGIVHVEEKLTERYHPKVVSYIEFAVPRNEAFEKASGKAQQENILLALAELSKFGEVSKDALIEKCSLPTTSTLQTLEKKGVIRTVKKEVNRFHFSGEIKDCMPVLSAAQTSARDSILNLWNEKPVVLLNGVTSSGKTEIYIDLIYRILASGKRAFFLVPEIALTTQLTSRLQAYFGNKVLIYHSKFTDSERVDIWRKLLGSNEPCIVIGARSAVFLPFGNLGLVIVDEEHEPSYKQADPAPRYNARDVAIVLASMHGAKALLGSATPAVETRYKAESGKFGLVELKERYGNLPLPSIIVSDIGQARKEKMYRAPFTFEMLRRTNQALSVKGKQAIFFLNRRGFAPVARCGACDWSPRCPNCDVALTYHKSRRLLECHYCGTVQQLPVVCPQCGEPKVEIYGFGTERVEDSVSENFPGKKILRMDLDTTRNKDGHQKIISAFSEGKADILVGTQMVTKGLDFGRVNLVGVLNADSLLNLPDFRASERTFNMLEQVAGRAGRRAGEEGIVVIQTSRPDHPVIKAIANHDYPGYYAKELQERKEFNFPPFSRIVTVTLKHKDNEIVHKAARKLTDMLRQQLGSRVTGPQLPLVARIQTYHIRNIMLKVEVAASIAHVKQILRQAHISLITNHPDLKYVIIQYDVDPV